MLDRRGHAPIDRYVVEEYLAEGGMGAIFLGKKMGAGGFQKRVVLKQLLPEFTEEPEFIELFLREARLSATLDHANIVHTIDFVTAGAEYFIVMEYLDGADLRSLLKRAKLYRRRIDAACALYIAREVLSALQYAHTKLSSDGSPLGLIHRDVSPSNILVSRDGEVKLTDFGIAKASTHNSGLYRVKGKVGYMSPEQARSEPLDARSDLYSVAVCLYEVITGEKLFVQAGLTTAVENLYAQPIPLLSRKVKGLPADLDKVMLKALSIDPDFRYQTAGEFHEALVRLAHRHGLMMAAPDCARHLEYVCGPPSDWRELGGVAVDPAGTEIYSVEGTEQIDVGDIDQPSELLSAVFDLDDLVDEDVRRGARAATSITRLNELQAVELTSFSPAIDPDAVPAGAKPLVNLDEYRTSFHSSSRSSSVTDEGPVSQVFTPTPAPATGDREARGQRVDTTESGRGVGPTQKSRLSLIFAIAVAAIVVGIIASIGLSGPQIPQGSETPTTR